LDHLPNGFPSTESGVGIKLLKKIFQDPEDAGNWLKLNAKPEPIEAIAGRFEKPTAAVQAIVDRLVEKGERV